MADFPDLGVGGGFEAPAPSLNLGDFAPQYGPAFTGSTLSDVLQAGGTPAQGGGGEGGWWSNLTGGLGKMLDPVASAAKAISPIAGLGAAGAGIAGSIMGMKQGGQARAAQQQAMGTQRDVSRAVLPSATALTQEGAAAMLGGPLPSGIQAQVDDFKRKSKAEINQYLSHAGIADSTMMAQWDAYIEQQATLYGQQLSQGLYGQGLQGLGVAGSGASALSSSATQLGAGVPSSISDANKALAMLAAQS
jgi:hypothetical protein